MRRSEGRRKLERSRRKCRKDGCIVVRPCNEEGRGVCGKRNDGAESGRGQEKRRTEVKMDG